MTKEKVLFIHMNQLGDMLFSLPLIQAARRQWPDHELVSFARQSLAGLLEDQGLVDSMVNKTTSFYRNYKTLNALGKFSKAILFSESPESLIMAKLLGCKERIGFKTASLNFMLTAKAEKFGVPSIENNLRLATVAGLTTIAKDYNGILKIPMKYKKSSEEYYRANSIDKANAIAFGIGASKRRKGKTWPFQKWGSLMTELIKSGFHCIIIASPQEVLALDNFVKSFERNVHICSSAESILDTAAVISSSKLFVGTDSGAMHLAAALGVRVISLFGETDPKQVGPMPLINHMIIKNNQINELKVEQVLSLVMSNFN